jgi:hypothetical protein
MDFETGLRMVQVMLGFSKPEQEPEQPELRDAPVTPGTSTLDAVQSKPVVNPTPTEYDNSPATGMNGIRG